MLERNLVLWGGQNVIAEVFTVALSKIKKLGSVKWNTASTKGETSVVYAFLHENKLVSVKDFKDSNGYYSQRKSKIEIHQL